MNQESELPGGTVTFLFTDIAGSTQLLHQLGEDYKVLLAGHHRIVRQAIERRGGREVSTEGDAFFVSFPKATEAVAAAVEIQRALAEESWPGGAQVSVRMGLHTGEPWIFEADYAGIDVHRAARIAHVGHGGQALLSETTTALVRDELPVDVALRDLGHYQLKDMRRPERIHQLVIEGLPADFPPLKAQAVVSPKEVYEPARLPAFLKEEGERPGPLFVGREREMDWLMERVEPVMKGEKGRPLLFILGDPGSGKSALLQALAHRASEMRPDLLVAFGASNAFSGLGDPYLPFRDILNTLTGDVEEGWRAGTLTTGQALALWEALPETARALTGQGLGMLGSLLDGRATLARFRAALPPNDPALAELGARVEGGHGAGAELDQSQLFGQVTQTLRTLADKRPLLIALDDLQWADQASVNLLFHLARRLPGSRVMLVGAYRPEEVTLGREGDRHPLEKVVAEVQRAFGQVTLDLNLAAPDEGQAFVEALIDAEPNSLGLAFREALLAHTGGHPLFTLEMLRTLQERGDLIQNAEGRWVESSNLSWEALPDRLEGVVAERIGRLEEELREILSVAAVEGERFTAQVVARIQELQERGLLRTLSRELERRHKLVQEGEARQVGQKLLSRYRFSHALFQRYLYNDLSAGERQLLHGEIGTILEDLYAGREEEIAVQLALHFTEAADGEKAVHYSLQAGDSAIGLFAFGEAAKAFEQALVFLRERTDQELAARTLMKLGLVYHRNFEFERSRVVYEEGFALLNALSASSSRANRAPAARPLRILTEGSHITLDPTRASDGASITVVHQLFEGLVEMTQDGELAPALARSWEIEEGGTRYVFHLRDNIRWSDGKPITAHDLVFAWRWALRPGTGDYPANQLYDVKGARAYHEGRLADPTELGIKAITERSVVVELEEPVGYFLLLLELPISYPIPKHVVEEFGEDWAEPEQLVGSGAFVLEDQEPGGSVNLRRNPYYTGWVKGNIMTALIKVAPMEQHLAIYEAGEVDAMNLWGLTMEEERYAGQRYPDEQGVIMGAITASVLIRVQEPPFDDIRVRQALAQSIDKHALVRMLGPNQFPATGGYVPPGMPGHVRGVSLGYDPRRAQRLLAKAGFPNGQEFPTFVLLIGDAPWFTVTANEIARQWRDVLGIPVVVEAASWANYNEMALGKSERTQIILNAWSADYNDPDSFLRANFFRLVTGWNNQEYNRLVDQARVSVDRELRLAHYRKAEEIIAQRTPMIPILYTWQGFMARPWLKYYLPSGTQTVWLFKHLILEERDEN